ncbi:MAG TPA: branched-chain amino acid ABC transporter permease [Thermoleophilia bacterium]
MDRWFQLLVSGITMGSIYSLIALGYVTIYRTSRIVNMAQGSFVMLGGFICFSLLSEVGLPFWAAGLLGIISVAVIAIGMYRFVLAPIVKVSLVAMILCTVGLSILFENLALLRWGGFGKMLPGFTGEKSLFLGGVSVAPQSLWIVGIMIVVFVALYWLNSHTKIGRRMTATATNPSAASLCGVSTGRIVVVAFVISATIGALGGISIASVVPVSFTSGGVFGLNGFVAAILGGWGSSGGAVLGGLSLGLIQSLATGVVPAGYQDAIAFALFILVLYFRPQGILGAPVVDAQS